MQIFVSLALLAGFQANANPPSPRLWDKQDVSLWGWRVLLGFGLLWRFPSAESHGNMNTRASQNLALASVRAINLWFIRTKLRVENTNETSSKRRFWVNPDHPKVIILSSFTHHHVCSKPEAFVHIQNSISYFLSIHFMLHKLIRHKQLLNFLIWVWLFPMICFLLDCVADLFWWMTNTE